MFGKKNYGKKHLSRANNGNSSTKVTEEHVGVNGYAPENVLDAEGVIAEYHGLGERIEFPPLNPNFSRIGSSNRLPPYSLPINSKRYVVSFGASPFQ